MARHKDGDWKLPDRCADWTQVEVAILMDIRDELKQLNRLLRCPNFLAIPYTLNKIERNTRKPKRRKVKS